MFFGKTELRATMYNTTRHMETRAARLRSARLYRGLMKSWRPHAANLGHSPCRSQISSQKGSPQGRSPHAQMVARLEDGGGRGAAHAARRVEGVDAEELVDEAARDAHHRRAAVLALGVELEGLDLGVVVAHPRVEGDVAGLSVVGLRLGGEALAGLLHAGEDHDLQPARGRDGLERGEAANRDVGKLEVLRRGQVARHDDASLEGNDVEEAK